MKQIKLQNVFLAAIMMVALFVTSCAKEDIPAPEPVVKGKVTFIYYGQSDDALAVEGLNQLKEIGNACETGYRCVAMANFPKETREKLAQELGTDMAGTLTFGMENKERKLLDNSGETLIDMSKAETFIALLNKAVELYPADEYVVLFNGHGGGWEYKEDGIRSTPAGDETMKGLTVRGISNGIKLSALNGKVKLIYFGSCLMVGYEYLGDLASCTSYIVGNSTVSWAINEEAGKLINLVKGTTDWASVSKSMASYLGEQYESYRSVSLAVKTEGATALFAKMKQMNELLNTIGKADENKREAILTARDSCFCFYPEAAWQMSDMRDVNDFYYRLQSIDASLKQPYADFVAALDNVVIASAAGTPVKGLAEGNTRYGLSMLLFETLIYDDYIKNTFYKDLLFTKETNPEKLFYLFERPN